jgi:hypothetical protein
MKKIILLAFLLASCSDKESIVKYPLSVDSTIAPSAEPTAVAPIDSVMEKMNSLIHSTENVGNKVTEIKTLKKENVQLKQELVVAKSQLEEVKAIMADTSDGVKKKKRNFLQKIVDTIKKDTVK